MRDVAASYVIPICWITVREGKPFILDSGSAIVCDCGDRPFVVTADDEPSGRPKCKMEHPTLCIVGAPRFVPIGRVIASDPVCDVATFRVTPDEIKQLAAGKEPSARLLARLVHVLLEQFA
jgi:hypothetical protein